MICIPDVTITLNILALIPIGALMLIGFWYLVGHILPLAD